MSDTSPPPPPSAPEPTTTTKKSPYKEPPPPMPERPDRSTNRSASPATTTTEEDRKERRIVHRRITLLNLSQLQEEHDAETMLHSGGGFYDRRGGGSSSNNVHAPLVPTTRDAAMRTTWRPEAVKLNSPRSLLACRMCGIDPFADLENRNVAYFAKDDKDLAWHRYHRYERKRQELLDQLIMVRQQIIDTEDDEQTQRRLAFHNHETDEELKRARRDKEHFHVVGSHGVQGRGEPVSQMLVDLHQHEEQKRLRQKRAKENLEKFEEERRQREQAVIEARTAAARERREERIASIKLYRHAPSPLRSGSHVIVEPSNKGPRSYSAPRTRSGSQLSSTTTGEEGGEGGTAASTPRRDTTSGGVIVRPETYEDHAAMVKARREKIAQFKQQHNERMVQRTEDRRSEVHEAQRRMNQQANERRSVSVQRSGSAHSTTNGGASTPRPRARSAVRQQTPTFRMVDQRSEEAKVRRAQIELMDNERRERALREIEQEHDELIEQHERDRQSTISHSRSFNNDRLKEVKERRMAIERMQEERRRSNATSGHQAHHLEGAGSKEGAVHADRASELAAIVRVHAQEHADQVRRAKERRLAIEAMQQQRAEAAVLVKEEQQAMSKDERLVQRKLERERLRELNEDRQVQALRTRRSIAFLEEERRRAAHHQHQSLSH